MHTKHFLNLILNGLWNYGYEYAQVQITTNNGSTWTPLNGQYTISEESLPWELL